MSCGLDLIAIDPATMSAECDALRAGPWQIGKSSSYWEPANAWDGSVACTQRSLAAIRCEGGVLRFQARPSFDMSKMIR